MNARAKIFLAICFCGLISLVGRGEDGFSAGPLFDEFSLTLAPGHRKEAVGPFYSSQVSENERQISVPSLFCWTHDDDLDIAKLESFYPILTYSRFGAEYRWQLFQLLSWAGGQSQEEIPRKRFTLFPFYFQQRSADTNHNYTALLPFYGHIQGRLFRDDIRFVMFPLYSETRKKDMVTDNYLFPFFHLRHGEELNGWQFWPLVGNEHKGITFRTNSLDEVVTVAGYEKFFALWPFYFRDRLGRGTENPEERRVIVPVISIYHAPQRDSISYGWPFGYTVTDDREKKYHEKDLFWPLIVKADGETRKVRRVWPFFSQATNQYLESDFYLWPVYKFNRLNAPPLDRQRTRILFILYSLTSEKNVETKTEFRRVDQWPFFTMRKDRDGSQRTQILAIIEPWLPNAKGVEHNWAPLYSLWRAEKNGKTGDTSQSLLWNLYRRDTTKETKKVSFLFGLFQHQVTREGNHWRIFFIGSGKAKEAKAEK